MGKKTFLGVSSKAHKVKKIFLGVGGKAHKVKKGYIGVGGKAHQFFTLGSADSGVYAHDSYDHHRFCKVDPYTLAILSSASYGGDLISNDGISRIKGVCPGEGSLIVASVGEYASDPYRLTEISPNTGAIIRSVKGTSNIASTTNPFGYYKNSTTFYGYDVLFGGTGDKIFQSFLNATRINNNWMGSISAFDKNTFASVSAGNNNVTVATSSRPKCRITGDSSNVWVVQNYIDDDQNFVSSAKYSSLTWARLVTRYWNTHTDSYSSQTTYNYSNLPGSDNTLEHSYYNANQGVLKVLSASLAQISSANMPHDLYWTTEIFSVN